MFFHEGSWKKATQLRPSLPPPAVQLQYMDTRLPTPSCAASWQFLTSGMLCLSLSIFTDDAQGLCLNPKLRNK